MQSPSSPIRLHQVVCAGIFNFLAREPPPASSPPTLSQPLIPPPFVFVFTRQTARTPHPWHRAGRPRFFQLAFLVQLDFQAQGTVHTLSALPGFVSVNACSSQLFTRAAKEGKGFSFPPPPLFFSILYKAFRPGPRSSTMADLSPPPVNAPGDQESHSFREFFLEGRTLFVPLRSLPSSASPLRAASFFALF